MTDAIWVTARSTGTAALVALILSVLSGMALRSGALAWLSHNRAVRAVHDLTSLLWLPLAIAHVIALMLDPYAKIGFADLLVPFLVSYGSLAIGLGTISLQLVVIRAHLDVAEVVAHATGLARDPPAVVCRVRRGVRARAARGDGLRAARPDRPRVGDGRAAPDRRRPAAHRRPYGQLPARSKIVVIPCPTPMHIVTSA